MTEPAAAQRILGLVGLGMRARLVVAGVDRVRDAAKRGVLQLAVVAPDAARNSLDKVVPLLRARRIEMVSAPSAGALGHAVGRQETTVVGITDRDLARGIRAIVRSDPVGVA